MSQEIIISYLKTAEFLKNKFVLDFLQTEKEYYITSMNCNLIIHEDYELVSDEKKHLSKKSNLSFQKGPDCLFKIVNINFLM